MSLTLSLQESLSLLFFKSLLPIATDPIYIYSFRSIERIFDRIPVTNTISYPLSAISIR